MRFGLILSTFVFISCKVSAQRFIIIPYSGIEVSDMSWSIAPDFSNDKKKLSELKWKDLKAKSLNLDIHYNLSKKISIIGTAEYRYIYSGDVQDIDFDQNNNIVKNQDFNGAGSRSKAFTIGLQSPLYKKSNHNSFSVHLRVSYYHKKSIYMMAGSETYYPQLNSTYKISLNGIDAGVATSYSFSRISVSYGLKCMYLNYFAAANWNLITEYKHPLSFAHYSRAIQLQNELNLSLKLNKSLNLFSSFMISQLDVFQGKDYLYYANGDIAGTMFNGADEKIKNLSLGLKIEI